MSDPRASHGTAVASAGRISPRQLQRTTLARQGLLARTSESIPQVLSRIAGLQSQYAPTM